MLSPTSRLIGAVLFLSGAIAVLAVVLLSGRVSSHHVAQQSIERAVSTTTRQTTVVQPLPSTPHATAPTPTVDSAHEAADLQGRNLQWSDLRRRDLEGANVAGANLQHADAAAANLAQASFSGANLQHADLDGASLIGADLSGADLEHANLADANLENARLAGANLNDVTWSNTVCPDGTNSSDDGGTCTNHL